MDRQNYDSQDRASIAASRGKNPYLPRCIIIDAPLVVPGVGLEPEGLGREPRTYSAYKALLL